MTYTPLVSIVIPVYNGANYMREAIDSALAQTYKNIEIIVVNDGSTDHGATEAVARSYGDRIRYVQQKNGGVAAALNRGIKEMRGEYFSWLSHDDVYYPNKVEVQIAYLRNMVHRDVILYSDFEYIDAQGICQWFNRIPTRDPKRFLFYLLIDPCVHGCTTLIPRRCFDTVGSFNEQLKTTQDHAMWFTLGKGYRFRQIPEVLVRSRIHPEQGSLTIPGHEKEANALYIWMMEQIDPVMVRSFGEPSSSEFFAKVAFTMDRLGFKEAAAFAKRCSWKALTAEAAPGMVLRTIGLYIMDTGFIFLRGIKRSMKALLLTARAHA